MEEKTKRRLYIYLPWVLLIAVLGAAALFGFIHKEEFQSIRDEVYQG